MYILGDIGNTETKIYLISINNKIIKKLTLLTKEISYTKLNKSFIVIDFILKIFIIKSSIF